MTAATLTGDAPLGGDGAENAMILPAGDLAAKAARDHVARVFTGWGLEDYPARTVVTELVTNARRHACTAPDEPVVARIWLRADGCPVVEVWDTSDTEPRIGTENYAAESGRGLLMVEALAEGWGTRPLQNGGKVVYAVMTPVQAQR